jgi:RNA polymerase sigma-70 factor (ECF subfamily)
VLTSELERPDTLAERAESITLAFLVLLETLSPEERAVFLLKETFDYEHAEIADMLGTSVENSRQLLHRAKAKLARGRPPLSGTSASRREVAERFASAFVSGDRSALTALLARDVGILTDGGGKATAARRPIVGVNQVVEFFLGLRRTAATAGVLPQASLAIEDVNAEPALVVRMAGRLESIFVLSIADGLVTAVRVVRNPDKLAHIDGRLTQSH